VRKLKHRELERHIRRANQELEWWLEHVQHPRTRKYVTRLALVCERANDDLDEGLRARNYDGSGRGGNDLTQPESHVDARMWIDDEGHVIINPDITADRITKLAGVIALTTDTAIAAQELGSKLIISSEERDRQAQAAVSSAVGTAGAGHCKNCTEWVPGTRDDRLRGGRCKPCDGYQRAHHGNERPSELWAGKHRPAATDAR
jgi:hypothetical protein